MRCYSLPVPLLALSCLAAPVAQAQQPDSAAANRAMAQPARVYTPVLLLNARLIIGDAELRGLNPQAIRRVTIYKSIDAPAKWLSLTKYGIIDLTVSQKLRLTSRSLPALRRWLKVRGLVVFQLDGVRLSDESLRVATAAIAALEVTRPAAAGGATVINIRVVRLPPPPVPPGQIRIRGLVQQAQ